MPPETAAPASPATKVSAAALPAPAPAPFPLRPIDTIQTVLTALLLAFVFRTFFVEPFIIPTGSMAGTLLGAHARVYCQSCGYEFPVSATLSPTGRGGDHAFADAVCPLCRQATPVARAALASGDRILVHKWPYDLPGWPGWSGPRRWDVIVFRDPAEPEQNYIKRVAGLPGESVELVAGDLFINGRVARKPPHIQRGLWLPVFSQEHRPRYATAATPAWITESGSGWSGLETRALHFASSDEQSVPLLLDPGVARAAFLDMNGYNRRSSGDLVGDLRLSAELVVESGAPGFRMVLTLNETAFTAEFGSGGFVRLLEENPAEPPAVHERTGLAPPIGRATPIEFARLDGRITLRIAGRLWLATPEDQYRPSAEGLRRDGLDSVGLRLEGAGPGVFSLRRLRIDRDIHYTAHPGRTMRAGPGQPFRLGEGEYFVLGDNSPDSRDSREWTEGSPQLPPGYRPGTVIQSQIVGLGAFVYLPSLLPSGIGETRVIPDLGRTRFIR